MPESPPRSAAAPASSAASAPAPRAGHRPPAGYRAADFPAFAVTVDVVVLTVLDDRLQVLLVRRAADPYAGAWALPGGFKRPDETLDEAAARELREETGFVVDRLVQFGAYGDPGRDPRLDVVTVAYLAAVPAVDGLAAGGDAVEAALHPVSRVRRGTVPVAFDHARLVTDARERVGQEVERTSLIRAFLPDEFTLSDLRRTYEAVWRDLEVGYRVDPHNLRRTLARFDPPIVTPVGRTRTAPGSDGRPPELHRATAAWTDDVAPLRRPRSTVPTE
jgi:8-oxo-dGTP diphosphatase